MYVIDKDGVQGAIGLAAQSLDALTQVPVTLPGGGQALVPVDALEQRDAQNYYLPLRLADLPRYNPSDPQAVEHDRITIPVMEETLEVDKRVQERGVRIAKKVRQREEVVEEPILREDVTVERVALNRQVDSPPPIRQEGDTLIIPLLEEVVVVEKRLMLREELRVTRHRTEQKQPQRVTLRREEVTVERHAENRDTTKP